jgi:hypothetical protein
MLPPISGGVRWILSEGFAIKNTIQHWGLAHTFFAARQRQSRLTIAKTHQHFRAPRASPPPSHQHLPNIFLPQAPPSSGAFAAASAMSQSVYKSIG